MLRAAQAIGRTLPGGVLVKGGHRSSRTPTTCSCAGRVRPTGTGLRRVDNPNNHGSGCTLSSAIASFQALAADLPRAVGRAKAYITACMEARAGPGGRQSAR